MPRAIFVVTLLLLAALDVFGQVTIGRLKEDHTFDKNTLIRQGTLVEITAATQDDLTVSIDVDRRFVVQKRENLFDILVDDNGYFSQPQPTRPKGPSIAWTIDPVKGGPTYLTTPRLFLDEIRDFYPGHKVVPFSTPVIIGQPPYMTADNPNAESAIMQNSASSLLQKTALEQALSGFITMPADRAAAAAKQLFGTDSFKITISIDGYNAGDSIK